MSTDAELHCPTCQTSFPERRAIRHTRIIWQDRCPTCQTVVHEGDQTHYVDRALWVQEDLAALDAWVEAVGEERRLRLVRHDPVSAGETYRWEVEGLGLPWACTVVYDPSHPDQVEVRLHTLEAAETVLAGGQRHIDVCADHGLQPHGERTLIDADLGRTLAEAALQAREAAGEDSPDEMMLPGEDAAEVAPPAPARWGVRQLLGTGCLSPGLFRGTVRRLDAAMRDVATAFGLPLG